MQLSYSDKHLRVLDIIEKLIEACDKLQRWNEDINDYEDYGTKLDGDMRLAVSCMLIEMIGGEIKKIDKILPGYIEEAEPTIRWRQLKGMRDRLAHGYLDVDPEIVLDVVKNEMPSIHAAFIRIKDKTASEIQGLRGWRIFCNFAL